MNRKKFDFSKFYSDSVAEFDKYALDKVAKINKLTGLNFYYTRDEYCVKIWNERVIFCCYTSVEFQALINWIEFGIEFENYK